MTAELTDERRATLRSLCDTIVPCVEREHDPDGFWARTASDVGADEAVAQTIATLPEEQRAGLVQLLDAPGGQGLERVSPRSREQLLRNLELASRDAAAGLAALTGMTLFFTYGVADPQTAQNPNWRAFGYPGPISAPAEVQKPISPLVPEGETTLEADVVVIGSGAGAGVIAQEEIFGPVLSIIPYDDEDDAVRIANDSIYGLAGGVWSGDEERAKRVARRIRTGQVEINGGVFNPEAPFGGYKQSGHGRELGHFALEEFLQVKAMQL